MQLSPSSSLSVDAVDAARLAMLVPIAYTHSLEKEREGERASKDRQNTAAAVVNKTAHRVSCVLRCWCRGWC